MTDLVWGCALASARSFVSRLSTLAARCMMIEMEVPWLLASAAQARATRDMKRQATAFAAAAAATAGLPLERFEFSGPCDDGWPAVAALSSGIKVVSGNTRKPARFAHATKTAWLHGLNIAEGVPSSACMY